MKFAPTNRAINTTNTWKGTAEQLSSENSPLSGGNRYRGWTSPTLRSRPDVLLSFTAALRARVPAAFASGGRSHCVRYLRGSFDILRQFAFGKLARGVGRGRIETSESRSTHTRPPARRAGRRRRRLRRRPTTDLASCPTHTHVYGLRRVTELIAQCLSTNTLMKAPTKATGLLIKLAQNVTPLRNDAEPGAQCTAWMLLN